MRVSELSEKQKGYLRWRLEHNTCCSLFNSIHFTTGDYGDWELVDLFVHLGKRKNTASLLAKKVLKCEDIKNK